ncbi:MAG TPA: SMC-Scp complex subunit ScpB [Hungateiclostridium thermocellum]|uniref:Segregation and condensation protein B n=2 Tax=Acetivibrio thermocellus TaxID=1515 RepID=SCPB_ACET2|nr:SMC-Scp complex subunit ScpB [Acetivibrio thermocellus]A3DD94.1 RecName: Full=Segregation and condensation protein B [Acetivibrio thermocellus ATCC 27405]CDG35381.1 Segregation and condensation protein B [Acetivibrio thermocellus BC1]ABN51923.1 chromosome segregation and condensation protein, ScpB [Acetivibrio thermocellus ATCC 27405]ADU74597.1 chromosome segregation and condensation protein, ScpB [Acetivibrio thermocellus DSM 1313]ALX08541.1 chromosome segregation and condensation protein,
MDLKKLEGIFEGMLFASGDKVSIEKLSSITGIDKKTVKLVINNMIVKYNNDPSRGITIREINNGYQLCSKPEYYDYIKQLFEPKQRSGLSQAALETLAIIAYNRPITKAKIEQIRGVNSDSAITKLLEKNLIREAGRLDAPGKPVLYETTDEFFRSFGFKSDADLPIFELNDIHETVEINQNSEQEKADTELEKQEKA